MNVPRLLIVDDNDDNRFTLSLLLEVEGFTDITMAGDGEEALAVMEAEHFDLVLLDLMMPRLNGYQVLETLKAQGRIGDPPVIMITALDDVESAARCIELGAEDYLPKPFDPVLLKARLHGSLEKKALRDAVREAHDRMEAELRDARELQLGLCPRSFPTPTPTLPYDVFATMEPAREVGGDFYHVFERVDGSLCFAVGDVSDKGAAAALFMARSRDILRLSAETPLPGRLHLPTPGEILARVNRILCAANPALMFVTLWVGILGPEVGALHFANAGHNDPYRLSGGEGIATIGGTKGQPLGIRDGRPYETEGMSLVAGESLFVFSDGIPDASDRSGVRFSETRLERCLLAHSRASAAELVAAVMRSVTEFAAGAAPSDDITAMAIRLTSPAP